MQRGVFICRVFFSSLEAFEKIWTKRMGGNSEEEEYYSKLAGGHRLKPFSTIAMLDHFVTYYQGAYDHDKVFKMGLEHAYSLRLYHKELSEYQDRLNKVKQEFKNKTK